MKILTPGRMSFEAALALQEKLVADLQAGRAEETLVLLEHEPVYTIGRTRDRSSLRQNLPHPVFETNRGGQATFHGPGQLVGYPVLDLARRGRDLHRYLRFLEDLLIELSASYGVTAQNREGLTGVWVGPRKLASLGVGVRKWVSMHGFAINITRESTEAFAQITPCGLTGVEMTSLAQESGRDITLEDALARTADLFMQRIDHLTNSRTL
ncbi:MAG: lipoyl(octanoyl) transferase LipB [Verrucomicrobiota bacterium]